jgi:hypothetical protein
MSCGGLRHHLRQIALYRRTNQYDEMRIDHEGIATESRRARRSQRASRQAGTTGLDEEVRRLRVERGKVTGNG